MMWSKTSNKGGSSERVARWLAPRTVLPIALLGGACTSLLGIEELHPDPENAGGSGALGGSGASGGKGGSSGSSVGGAGGTSGTSSGGSSTGGNSTGGNSTGGSSGGSSGAASGSGGTSNEGGESGQGATGGSSGGSSGAGGSSGSSGAAGTGGMDSTVHGKVVNHWLQPIANVPVTIGSETTATDANGNFTIADVAATYDAELVVTFKRYGNEGPQYGWIYEGLTRRDPTLQVYQGLALRSGNLHYTPTNVSGASNEVAMGALGSQYGNWSREGGEVQTSMDWFGPSTITPSAHALSWLESSGLPTQYTAYSMLSAPIAVTDGGGTANFSLDFTPNTVTSFAVSGTVTSPSTDERTNGAWVRFSSGADIQVVNHYGQTLLADYSYTVPSLPMATVTVSALEGDSYRGAAACAHVDGVTSSQTNGDLDIPTPPTLVGPANGVTLADDQMFSWTGNAKTFVWFAISNNWFEGIYVVTTRKQITLPTFTSGLTFRPGDDGYWRVETHGDAQTVDEMTGPDGFADEFGYSQGDYPEGPRTESGTYSISLGRGFLVP